MTESDTKASDLPTWFSANTRNMYSCLSFRFCTLYVVISGLTFTTLDQEAFEASLASRMYSVIGDPPSLSLGFQVTVTAVLLMFENSIGPTGGDGLPVNMSL